MTIANGHHRPAHKHNDAASKCGLPYKIPRPHTIHGPSPAQRSSDHLPLSRKSSKTSESAAFEATLQNEQECRRAKSEHSGSPILRADNAMPPINTQLPLLDTTYAAFETMSPTSFPFSFDQANIADAFNKIQPTTEYEPPLSAMSATSVDWSGYDLPLDMNFSNAPSQPPSYASYDYNYAHAPIAASSSGDPSEFGDINPFSSVAASNQSASGLISPEDPSEVNSYRFSSASSLAAAHGDMLKSAFPSYDIDEYLREVAANAEPFNPQASATPPVDETQNFANHGYTIQQAQEFAHPHGQENTLQQNVNIPIKTSGEEEWQYLPVTTTGNDPMWTDAPFDAQGTIPNTGIPEETETDLTAPWVS